MMFLIKQILKFDPSALKRGRVHIRDVVGDDLDVELLGQHPGRTDVKRSHWLSPLRRRCTTGKTANHLHDSLVLLLHASIEAAV